MLEERRRRGCTSSSSWTELVVDAFIDAGSEVRLLGSSRTGTAPSTNVAAAVDNNSAVSDRLGDTLSPGPSPDCDGSEWLSPSSANSSEGSPWSIRAAREINVSFLLGASSRISSSNLLRLVVTSGSRVEKVLSAAGFARARMCSDKICAQSS